MYCIIYNKSSVLDKHAVRQMFWFESFFIKANMLFSCESLCEIRFKYHFNTTNAVPEGVNLLVRFGEVLFK